MSTSGLLRGIFIGFGLPVQAGLSVLFLFVTIYGSFAFFHVPYRVEMDRSYMNVVIVY